MDVLKTVRSLHKHCIYPQAEECVKLRGTVKIQRDLKPFYSHGVAACAKTRFNEMLLLSGLRNKSRCIVINLEVGLTFKIFSN